MLNETEDVELYENEMLKALFAIYKAITTNSPHKIDQRFAIVRYLNHRLVV
jgi:hypothetical protein